MSNLFLATPTLADIILALGILALAIIFKYKIEKLNKLILEKK